jgi:hypothetical protein
VTKAYEDNHVYSLFLFVVANVVFVVVLFFLVGWDLRHQVLRPLLAYCTAPNDR